MKLINKTEFDDEFVLRIIRPQFYRLPVSAEIDYVKVENNIIPPYFNIEIKCLGSKTIKKFNDRRNISIGGRVKHFNDSTGCGTLVTKNGHNIKFYVCNFIGANSRYPSLVTNINVKRGDIVRGVLSSDVYMLDIGAYNLKKQVEK